MSTRRVRATQRRSDSNAMSSAGDVPEPSGTAWPRLCREAMPGGRTLSARRPLLVHVVRGEALEGTAHAKP